MIKKYRELQKLGLINMEDSFVPAVHYPPITKYPSITSKEFFQGFTPKNKLFDIYVHFPFCKGHCSFCHYPSLTGDIEKLVPKYLRSLFKEVELFKENLSIDKLSARSVLIGGGTPTYISPQNLDSFLSSFKKSIDLSGITQFNYDLDPATMIDQHGLPKLKLLRDHGVDRLTIGINSFNDDLLKATNRPHTASDAISAIEIAKSLGFIVNIEFIFGLPNQTLRSWTSTIQQAIKCDPDEIQLYRLKIIPYGDGQGNIDTADALKIDSIVEMKEAAQKLLNKAGYNQNLNRVFSKDPEIFSHYAHNQCCTLQDQVGFGVTAFSSLHDRFSINTDSYSDYLERIDNNLLPINRGLIRPAEEQTRWALILPLKNRSLLRKHFQTMTDRDPMDLFHNEISLLEDKNLIEVAPDEIRLTPMGRFFADEVVQLFYSKNYKVLPNNSYKPGVFNHCE